MGHRYPCADMELMFTVSEASYFGRMLMIILSLLVSRCLFFQNSPGVYINYRKWDIEFTCSSASCHKELRCLVSKYHITKAQQTLNSQ